MMRGHSLPRDKVKVTQSCPTLCNPCTAACQVPLSIEFSRQEYWSGLPFPSPGRLPNRGTEFTFPASSALSGVIFTTEPPGKSRTENEKFILGLAQVSWSELKIPVFF